MNSKSGNENPKPELTEEQKRELEALHCDVLKNAIMIKGPSNSALQLKVPVWRDQVLKLERMIAQHLGTQVRGFFEKGPKLVLMDHLRDELEDAELDYTFYFLSEEELFRDSPLPWPFPSRPRSGPCVTVCLAKLKGPGETCWFRGVSICSTDVAPNKLDGCIYAARRVLRAAKDGFARMYPTFDNAWVVFRELERRNLVSHITDQEDSDDVEYLAADSGVELTMHEVNLLAARDAKTAARAAKKAQKIEEKKS